MPSDGELWADVPRDGPGLDEPKDGRGVTRLESHSDTLSCAVVVLSVASPLLAACASLVRPTTKCSLHTRSSQKSSLKLQSCVSQLVQPILTDRSTIVQITRSEFPECGKHLAQVFLLVPLARKPFSPEPSDGRSARCPPDAQLLEYRL